LLPGPFVPFGLFSNPQLSERYEKYEGYEGSNCLRSPDRSYPSYYSYLSDAPNP
jgi:hypothetical protein